MTDVDTINHFSNKGKKWSPEEEKELLEQYEDGSRGILEIAKLHRRTVEGVISKLKTAGLVAKYARSEDYEQNVVGYSEYLADDEYREAERITRIKKEKPVQRLLGSQQSSHNNPDIALLKEEMKEMAEEIRTLKQQMSKLVGK
jgi:hypothetical protein